MKALPDFVAFFINSPIGRLQVETVSRQIMQNNINSEELRGLQIPLAPLDIQSQIMETVNQQRQAIAEERKAAKKREAEAAKEVEDMILGIRPVPK
jgi:type I restriction enzyme S subunit